ncbi:conjugal transfer protein TraF [Massilia sp. CMS3.1]|uniref:conjugal transfer protein TraF n=1 Tax=Massilia sp. CMS3.1 TaxID=3373083 RepID=UPI003EE59C61
MNQNKRYFLPAMAALALTLALAPIVSSAQDPDTRTTAVRSAPGPGPRYWSDNWRGWHFYEEPEPSDETDPPRKRQPSSVPAAPAQRRAPELVQFEALQKTLEQYRNIAIIKPTEANVRRYMELESKIVAQASHFADVAQRVAWATPELDPTLQGRPVNAKAIEVFEQDQLTTRSAAMAALGKDHVLFFFFRGDCPFCHAFAPTLEAFQARYGINVVAISVDGGPMPGFPNARADNGIARTLKVTQVPAVFLAQPYSGKISPIGFGVLSESQLLERISTVAAPATQEMAPGTNKHIVLR